MEVERPILARAVGQVTVFVAAVALDDADVLHLAIDLVGRGIDEEAFRALEANGFEHIERANRVDLEILARIGDGSGDRDLRRKMQHCVRSQFANETLDRVAVTDIGALETDLPLAPQPIEIVLRATPRQIVENGNRPALLVKMLGRIHADEPGAPRDQYRIHAALMQFAN